jgi:hypothetical protein
MKVARCGKGNSGLGSGSAGGVDVSNWQEAFQPGVDFQASGDVDHRARTVTRNLQRQWDQFTQSYQTGLDDADQAAMMKEWNPRTGEVYGYIRTTNSFAINEKLYDPKNDGKTDRQIFVQGAKKGHNGQKDLKTVQTLDRAINSHTTAANGIYTRFCSPGALQATFGLSAAQMAKLQTAGTMTPAQLRLLNRAFTGKTSFSKAYTSTSANRSMNAFSDPNAKQSKNYIFERKLYMPQGTKAYAPQRNAQESEVIFGRRLQTRVMGITVSNDGHVVIHEMFDGYK